MGDVVVVPCELLRRGCPERRREEAGASSLCVKLVGGTRHGGPRQPVIRPTVDAATGIIRSNCTETCSWMTVPIASTPRLWFGT